MSNNFQNNIFAAISDIAKHLSKDGLEQVLLLYFTLISVNTPLWAKVIIAAALMYVINPVDAIPDVIPITGFVDDIGVVAAAIKTISMFITDKERGQASNKATEWMTC